MSLWKKGGMPNRVESFGEVDRSKNRLTARLGFLKPIGNRLKGTLFDQE